MHNGINVNFEFADDAELDSAINMLLNERDRRRTATKRLKMSADGCKGAIGYLFNLLHNHDMYDDDRFDLAGDVLKEALPTCKQIIQRALDRVEQYSNLLSDDSNAYLIDRKYVEMSFKSADNALRIVKAKLDKKFTK